MSIGAAINDLVSSFYELFASVLGGIYNTIHALFAAVIGLFSGFINLIGDVFKGAVDVVGGLGKFLASKFAARPRFPNSIHPSSPDSISSLHLAHSKVIC